MRPRHERTNLARRMALVFAMSVSSSFAYAHALHLFASVSGDAIDGKTYYANGPAAGITVTVLGPGDEVLATVASDESGAFSWKPAKPCDIRFVAETVDGHRAEFTVAADELPGSLPVAETTPTEIPASIEVDRSDRSVQSDRPSAAPADLERLVVEAVSREVAPLREQLDAAAHRTQLRDIVGGIGYIVGVAGLFVLWKRRPPRSNR